MDAVWDAEWLGSDVVWADSAAVVSSYSGGKRRKPKYDFLDPASVRAMAEAAEPEAPVVETKPKAPKPRIVRAAPPKVEAPKPVDVVALLSKAIENAKEAAKNELRAEFTSLVNTERQRVANARQAKSEEARKASAEKAARKAHDEQVKAIAKAAKEEEDTVADLIAQKQKAARQTIAQAQKELIKLLGLKAPAL